MRFGSILFVILLSGSIVFFSTLIVQQMYVDPHRAVLAPASAGGYTSRLNDTLHSMLQARFEINIGENETLPVGSSELGRWIEQYFRAFTGKTELRINRDAIIGSLEDMAPGINQDPVSGRFVVRNGVIEEVVIARLGRRLDIEDSVRHISSALAGGLLEAQLTTREIKPEIDLGKLRLLGITTLLSHGVSDFSGSSSSRVHNITIGAQKLNGILIAPGEEFSFNNTIGPTNAAAGYKPNLVIKANTLIPEYGGGICQVSTTLFRAAIEAGLDITERRAHSLPVRFYNPQGYDATVYQDVVDLKFRNDTPSYILIQSLVTGNEISFEIYGRHDGRDVRVNTPVVYEAPGDGSMKTVFSRTIVLVDGTEHTEKFYSSYKSPQLFEEIRNPLE